MPEGPEIRRVADELAAALAGHRVLRVRFSFPRLRRYAARLAGAGITGVTARGKALLTGFDNGLTLYSHNQLYGRWRVLPDGDYPASSRSLRLAIHTGDTMALLYSASDIDVLETARLGQHPYLAGLGIELLAPDTGVDAVVARFEDSRYQRRNLMGLLQDQRFVAGMGNYLCCEALHVSGVHPSARLVDLDRRQRRRLARNCLALTRQSYETGGITNRLARAEKLRRQGLPFEDYRFHVYRREGLPCYRCGTPIEKGRYGGRAGYICPGCQVRA